MKIVIFFENKSAKNSLNFLTKRSICGIIIRIMENAVLRTAK